MFRSAIDQIRTAYLSPTDTIVEAESAIRQASNAIYCIAGCQSFFTLVFYLAGTEQTIYDFFIDVPVMLCAAVFLRTRKSRGAALILFLLAAGIAAVTISNRVGTTGSGGRNLVIAAFFLLIAYRGLVTTWAYHRLGRSVALWKNILRTNLLFLAIFAVSMVVLVMGLHHLYLDTSDSPSDEALGMLMLTLIWASLILTAAIQKNRWPFAHFPEEIALPEDINDE